MSVIGRARSREVQAAGRASRMLAHGIVTALTAGLLIAVPFASASEAEAAEVRAASPGPAPQQRPVPAEAKPFQGLGSAAAVPSEPAGAKAAGKPTAARMTKLVSGTARQVKVAGGGTVALAGPLAEPNRVFTLPGITIGATSLIVYFNPNVIDDTNLSWTRWQPIVTDTTTNTQQAGAIYNRDDPANLCGLPTLYCRTLSSAEGWTLAPDRAYTVTIRVYQPNGTTLDSAPSAPSQARATIDPPALPVDQVAGCACPNILTRAPGVQALRGDLVNTGTGAYVRTERDAGVASFGLPFQAVRLYSSTKAHAGMFGPGWSWTYDAEIEPLADGRVRVWAEDGSSAVFTPNGTGYNRPLRVQSRLAKQGTGWRLSTADQRLLDFDAAGRLTKVASRRGLGVTLGYDTTGRLTTATDAAGRVVRFETAADGQITKMTLADGRFVTYTYEAGLLKTVRDARLQLWKYGYDTGNRLATVTDPKNVVIARVTYGTDTRVSTQTDAAGSAIRYTWNPATEIATATDADGVVTTDGYRRGVLVSSRNGQGNTVNVRYDAGLNANLAVDAVGNQTDVEHDAEGNVTQVRSPDPLGYVENNSYDSSNNLKKHTDNRRQPWRYEYNAQNDMTAQADPEQAGGDDSATWQGYTYTYDARGLVSTKTDPRKKVTRYEYDTAGNRTAEITPTGRRTEFGYDSSGRITTITDPRGTGNVGVVTREAYTTRIGYDQDDRVVWKHDPNKKLAAVTTYDEAGQVSATVDPLLRTSRVERDTAGRVTALIDPKNHTTRYTYTPAGRTATVTDASGARTTWTYESRGRVQTELSPRGNRLKDSGASAATLALYTTTFAYDPAGNLRQSSRPYPSDPTKKVLVDGTFDQLNRPVEQIDELGKTTKVQYDQNGNVSGMEDEDQRTLGYSYDRAGRRVDGVENGLDTPARIDYDKAGNAVQQISPTNGTTKWQYDDDGRPTAVTEPRGFVGGANPDDFTTRYGYDLAGNMTTVTDPLGNVSTQVFDATDRIVESEDGNGNTTRSIFDDADQPVAVFGPTAKGTARDYLAAFQALKVTVTGKGPVSGTVIAPGSAISATSFAVTSLAAFAGIPVTRYAFDGTGLTVAMADQLSRVRRTDYDDVDRPVAQVDPLGRVKRMTYDADGNVATTRAASNTPDLLLSDAQKAALTTSYTYNPIGWMTDRKLGNGPTYTYGYSATGRVTSMGDPAGRTDIEYNNTGLVKNVKRGVRQFSYTYDDNDNVETRTYPDGTRITAGYDAGDRVEDVTTTRGGSSQRFAFGYDPADRLTSTTYPASTGATENVGYDRAGRLTSLSSTSGTGARSGYALTLDAVGSPTKVTSTRSDGGGAPTVTETSAYSYDASRRLTDACYGAATCNLGDAFAEKYSYDYDLVGNRSKQVKTKTGAGIGGLPAITTTSYSYDLADQLKLETAIGAEPKLTPYEYDGEGNQTRAGNDRFTYNVDNTLASSTSGGQTSTFAYDGAGSRIAATTGTGANQQTRSWEWDTVNDLPMLAVESTNAGGVAAGPAGGQNATTARAYTYSPTGLTLALHTGAAGAAAGSVYTHDWLGGTAGVLGANGSLSWAYDYDPFGNPRGDTAAITAGGRKVAANAPANPLQYTGGYSDVDGPASNYHLRARDYDPGTGRFTGVDPLPRELGSAGASGYLYTDNQATATVDPSGLRHPTTKPADADGDPLTSGDDPPTVPGENEDAGNTVTPEYQKALDELNAQKAAAQQSVNEAESFTKQLGDEIIGLVMDLIGVTDARSCVQDGDIGACISTALNAVPWGKIFKAAKVAIKAVGIGRRLIEGYGRLKAARAALQAITQRAALVAQEGARASKKALEEAKRLAVKKAAETRAAAQRAREAAAKAKQEAAKAAARAKLKAQQALEKVRNSRCAGLSETNSFEGDTRVVMADGSTKAIADVEAGDAVLAGPESAVDEETAVAQSAADHEQGTGPATSAEDARPVARQVTAAIEGHGVKQLVDLRFAGAGAGGGGPPATLTATAGHPLWTTEDGWVRAGDIEPGDHLVTPAGGTVTVSSATGRTGTATVHNLTVDDRHTYYVEAPEGGSPVLAHNCGGKIGGHKASCTCSAGGPVKGPRNGKLAGTNHPVTGVPFDAQGFPDFSAWQHPTVANVRIQLSGNRPTDALRANRAAGLPSTPAGYTWHHHQDCGVMQLVQEPIHRRTGHTGGFSIC